MKYEAASMRTKQALAESLKKFMRQKPFSKITVTEIVADCGVNRKTFYYHFEDIYALLRWIFEQEAVSMLERFDLIEDYEDAMKFVAGYIDENIDLLRSAYDAFGSVALGRFFHASFVGLTGKLCEFLSEAASGMMLNRISGVAPSGSAQMARPVRSIVRACIVGVLTEDGVPFDPAAE